MAYVTVEIGNENALACVEHEEHSDGHNVRLRLRTGLCQLVSEQPTRAQAFRLAAERLEETAKELRRLADKKDGL